MLSEWQGILLVSGFCGLVAGVGLLFMAYRGPGRRPVSPIVLLSHRGRAPGIITRLAKGPDGSGTVSVAYSVDGERHELMARFESDRRGYYADAEYSMSLDMSVPTDWREYETTTLGAIAEGGSIVVAYDTKDPTDAVLLANPHDPRGPRFG